VSHMFGKWARALAALSVVGVAFLLVACGGRTGSVVPGGSGSIVAPQAVGSQATRVAAIGERMLGSLTISPAQARDAISRVTHFSVYPMPLKGQPRRPMSFEVGRTATQALNTASNYDLVYYGGPVVSSLQSINLYVNDPASTWGTPSTFLNDYGNSSMIHILDQYMTTANTASGRYTYGGSYAIS
jgi:hypothetical protein